MVLAPVGIAGKLVTVTLPIALAPAGIEAVFCTANVPVPTTVAFNADAVA